MRSAVAQSITTHNSTWTRTRCNTALGRWCRRRLSFWENKRQILNNQGVQIAETPSNQGSRACVARKCGSVDSCLRAVNSLVCNNFSFQIQNLYYGNWCNYFDPRQFSPREGCRPASTNDIRRVNTVETCRDTSSLRLLTHYSIDCLMEYCPLNLRRSRNHRIIFYLFCFLHTIVEQSCAKHDESKKI